MKKRKKNLSEDEIQEFLNLHNFEKFFATTHYFIDQILNRKLFFRNKKLNSFQDELPIFFGESVEFFNNESVQILAAQYDEFVSTVSLKHPKSYQQEKEFTQSIIFAKKGMEHPMEYVKYLYPIYNDATGYELNVAIAQISKELFEIISRTKDSNVSDSESVIFVKDFLVLLSRRDMIGCVNHLKNFITSQKNYPDKARFIQKISELTTLAKLRDSQLKRMVINPNEFGRNLLRAIQYTQSHIEYFCKYIHRLVYIMSRGNRKYGKKYYQYDSQYFSHSKFDKMCKKELNDFHVFQKFLIKYSKTLKKMRNLNAHQVSGDFRLFLDKGIISFPVIGKTKEMRVKHKDISDKIINYAVFINKIKLHPHNPYDEMDDTFVSFR